MPQYLDENGNPIVSTQKTYLDPNTGEATEQPSDGFLSSFGKATGISNLSAKDLLGIAVPSVAASNAARGLFTEGRRVFDEARAAMSAPNPTELQRHINAAMPFVGSNLNTTTNQIEQGNYPGAAGTFAGTIANMMAPEALEKVPAVASKIAEGAGALKDKIYPTSQNVVPAEQAARNLGKALVVPVQAMPEFLGAATQEAGTIKAYAQANNIPINSTVDLAKAADATAKAVQDHFNTKILGPNAKDVVSVPSDYRGTKLNVEGSRATLDDINNRINAINQELNPNFRKATQGQTSAANVSDADLIAEKRKLTGILHDSLAEKTGLEPEDIASLRQQAGKLRTIADEVSLSANTNTTAAGKAAMGRSDIPTGTKLGMAERLLQAVQGGPEIIGNRAVNRAFRDVNPTELILPNPRTNPLNAPASNPVPDQNLTSQMVKPVYNQPLQEYIRRKQAARGSR